ncbi:PA14 domain-containing protein [Demequina sp. NBRC 110055]|uniref:PA14 domain-containing protein n=1 Tax=Demequina sp. NBRC 110055 TaxID=1570344 RepID=UPI0011855C3F|nr:PA14 domain-containing protein [Demequina sp. NBRC 110055]
MSTWPSPYSPLPLDALVATNDVSLEFDGTEEGLHAGADALGGDLGFTMVQPSTSEQTTGAGGADPDGLYQGYYLPQFVSLAGGSLVIDATKGIQYVLQGTSGSDRFRNTQDNAFGVPLASAGAKVQLSTTMTVPGNATNSAQGGLWFGPDDDNYVKLVVLTSGTSRQVQLAREIGGVMDTSAPTDDQVTSANVPITDATPVTLTLTLDAVTGTAHASYAIGAGATVELGEVGLPANFSDGSLLPELTSDPTTTAFGGVFATRRNMDSLTTPVPFAFADFSVSELDTVPPEAPEGLSVDAEPDSTGLTWTPSVDDDVEGYRVYRSAGSPVDPVAANLISGDELVSGTTFTDSRVFVGQEWVYAIHAVDEAGNESVTGIEATVPTPAPDGELVGKYDFTTSGGALASGYIRDSGAPYSEGAGFGWITADDGTPFNFGPNTRVRSNTNGITDGRLTSIIHLQYGQSTTVPPPTPGTNGVSTEQAVWELDVPNGAYAVVVAAGDTSDGNFDSSHTVVVEGETAIDGFDGAAPLYFEQGVVEVEVTDGKLTIAPTGGVNTKLSFVEIYEVEAAPLAAPGDFSAALGADEASVDLSWTAVAGAEEYLVYRSATSPVSTETPLTGEPVTGTTYTDDTVEAGQTYYYTVVAASSSAPQSSAAAEQSVEVPAAAVAPDAPANVTATADADSILVEWDAVAGAVGYQVFRGTSSEVATDGTPLSGGSAIAETEFDDTTAVPGTEYFYVVVAVGEDDLESEASVAASATVAEVVDPTLDAPANVTATADADSILVEWDAVAGAVGYQVFRGTSSEVATDGTPLSGGSAIAETEFDDTTAVPGTKYFYVVVAVGEDDLESEASAAASATVAEVVDPVECAATEWAVEYFAGTELAGPRIAEDCLSVINQTYASGESPADEVPATDYSARFSTTAEFAEAGDYVFALTHDDGARLLIDGDVVYDADNWSQGEARLVAVTLTAGDHDIVVEYVQRGYGASLVLDWELTETALCEAGEWSVAYYLGATLTGTPLASECLTEVNRNFAAGEAPMPGVPANNYSERVSGTIDIAAEGTYVFSLTHDDGARLIIDGETVYDENEWSGGAARAVPVPLTAGTHDVVIEHVQAGLASTLVLDWAIAQDVLCDASEWTAEYFAGTALAGPAIASQCLEEINETFGTGQSPMAGVPGANYSARFSTTVEIASADTYVFSLEHDDGARLIIDDTVVYEASEWSEGMARVVPVALDAGQHDIVVEYVQRGYDATVILSWDTVDDAVCDASEWSVDYFTGTELAGSPIGSECLTELDRSLATGESPLAGVPATYYSARFDRTVDFAETGTYVFSVTHDDGVRLLIDGVEVYAQTQWSEGIARAVPVPLTAGSHDITVEYVQRGYGAELVLDWALAVQEECTEDDWVLSYYVGTDAAGSPIAAECVANLDKSLPAGTAPTSGVPATYYSATAARTLSVAEAGTYEFSVRHDDGIAMTIDGEVVYEANGWTAGETATFAVPLEAGEHDIQITWVQAGGGAELIVDWEAPDTTAPSAPTSPNVSIGDDSITVHWTASASSDVVGYNVYRSTTPGVTPENGQLLTTLLATGTEFEDTTLLPNTAYYYVITAVDGAGNESGASSIVAAILVVVNDTIPPDAPENLEVQSGDAEVVLTWDPVDDVALAGYRVYRSLETGAYTGSVVVSGGDLITEPTYTDTFVDNNTTYFYQVVAVDDWDNASDPSNEVYATPRVPNTTDISVDFLATGGVPQAGYVADWGQAYGERTGSTQGEGLSYGWVDADGHELSLVGNGRDRARPGIDPNLNTIIHMQYGDVDGGNGTNGVKTPGAWEIEVPDGLYEVTVAVGDQMGATEYDSLHVINVEGSVAIEGFQGSAADEFETVTTEVGVYDGRLTIDARGGFNTKMAYVEIVGLEVDRPHIDVVNPLNRSTDADVTGGVAATFARVHAGGGVDDTTMPGNVKVFNVATGAEVPGSVNTSGGNDTINFDPDGEFAPNTTYRFTVSSEVKDLFGLPFVPFTSIFTTGDGVIVGGEEFTPLTNVAFEKVQITLPNVNKYWASFTFGPDERLYGTTIGQGLFRFDVNEETGALSNMTDLGYQGFAMVGLLFDESSTAGDLRVWVTKTSANVGNEQNQFISGISLLSGPNLENEKKVFAGLPRSQSDHLTNSMVYGPGGDIYVLQGSNQAAGDLDNSWGQRGEQLLTAALLHFDTEHPRVQAAVADAEGDNPLLVQTAPSGNSGEDARNGYNAASPYNPWAEDAALQIYATGIRNAYDLTYHSNGHIYVATNGTAGGGNSPGVTYNASTNTWTRVAAAGIPGFSSVNGQDVTAACLAREDRDPTYVPRSVPAISNHPTQRDHLYDVVEGGYYGHPNPTRCEFVLHEGNDPANPPQWAGQGGSKYPLGTLPESHYKGVAYDFEYNKSPNGTIEYQSKTFGGQLENRIIVVRFSNNNDLIFLQADPVTGAILGAQTEVGITGVPNSTIGGVGGFNDPLEVVEDTRNGNLYVNQYDRAGSSQGLFLLRVPASQQAAKVTSNKDELVFSAVRAGGTIDASTTAAHRTDAESITVTNESSEAQSLAASIGGTNAAEFAIEGTVPASLAPGASATFTVRFTPNSTAGEKAAQLVLATASSSVTVPLFGLAMFGIQGGNEPTLDQVLGTLGYEVNVGWTTLAGGMDPAARGDEVLEPLFTKSGTGPVTWKALAHYAPPDTVSFGWYTGDGGAAERVSLGAMNGTGGAGYQSLLPATTPGSVMQFDPAVDEFGFYYYSPYFTRYGYTEDRLNSPAGSAHRARIYPAENRNGVRIANTYILAFEDADNGDYQDYVFLVSGIKPVTDTGSGGDAIKVDFTTASGDLAAGYIRDFGQAFGSRTGADQGSGLTYGWKSLTTEDDVNLSVGGTTPGNARDRGTSQPDMRLDSFMHMQPSDVAGTFNGTNIDGYWEIQLPNGEYEVTVGVGDPAVNSDPESHVINAENEVLVPAFVPSGVAGSATRHSIRTATVEVADGFLTIDPRGGVNTKIGFIDIVPLTVTDPGGDDPSDGAQVKVNFQPASAPVPEGWTAETGGAFSSERGFGWLNAANDQPVDRTIATRYRTGALSGIAYPSDERLKTYAFMDNVTQPPYTDGYWEYEVPNGTYEIALSVGDANYLDSTHRVYVEGQPIINGFVPTTATPFQTGVRTVEVTDGRLTVSTDYSDVVDNATEGNTKINWVSIKGDGLEPSEPTTTAQVTFRPSTASVPAGWTADTGAAYNDTTGYGWLVNDAPFDRSSMTRLRATPAGNPLQQGLILMQNVTTTGSTIAGGTVGTWEYALANGTYTVTASVGDGEYTDSVHGLAAEGEPLIEGFTPTTGTPFASGSAEVLVSDGKLTLTPTGINTKVNWVTIAGTALSAPSLTISGNGAAIADHYDGGVVEVTAQALAASGASIESFTYSIDGATPVDYTAPFTLDEPGEYEVVFEATDSEDRVSTRTIAFTVLDIGGTLELTNTQIPHQPNGDPIPGLYDDVLTMHRMNSGTMSTGATPTLLYRSYDSATVEVENTGAKDLRITALTLGGGQAGQFQLVNAPTLPLIIEPGESQDLTVRFIGSGGAKGIRSASLTLASSAVGAASTVIELRAGYMAQPEGGNELSLGQVVDLFKSDTFVGAEDLGLGNGSENHGSPLNGDEVRSTLWKRLDSSKPVQAVQLASFHGQGGNETLRIGNNSVSMTGLDAQSLFPKTGAGNPVTLTLNNPAATFDMAVSGQSTNRTDYMAVKTWPFKDVDGDVVPGSWWVGHDYVSSVSQCGVGATNCDFQDNVYLVTNVLPVTPDATAPAAPAAPTGEADSSGVDLTWAASADADLMGYRVERSAFAAGPWTSASGTSVVTGTTFRDTGAPSAAATFYRIVALDATGNATPGAATAIDTSAVDVPAIRINAGGPTVTTGGNTWVADSPYVTGVNTKTYTNSAVTQIANTTDDVLYLTERSTTASPGTINYAIPVSGSGGYNVTMHFAEIYHGATGGGAGGTGKRVFSVNFEGGTTEIVNLDLNAQVAPMTAYTTTNTVSVVDGTLNISLVSTVDQPKVSAIEIVKASSGGGTPAANTFTYSAIANQQYSVSEAQGEMVGGVLYQFGGFDSQVAGSTPTSRSYKYTPGTNAWAAIAPLPYLAGNGGPGTGATHAGITTDGEDIYLAGGYISQNGSSGQMFGTVEVYKYDVSANAYTRLANLPQVRASGALEYLNGKLHFVSGTNLARTTEPVDHWTLDIANGATSWVTAAAIPEGRNHPGSAVVGGKLYIIGGQTGHDGPSVAHDDVFVYDPASNSWSASTPMPSAVNHHTSSTIVLDGRIVVIGGKLNHTTDTATVQAFNPTTAAWTQLTSLPAPRSSGVAGVVGSGFLYTGGGPASGWRATPVV